MELVKTWRETSPLRTDHVRLSGEILHADGVRECLWFEYPEACAGEVTESGNPWLIALAPWALHQGESLRVNLPVCPVLLANVRRLVDLWCEWFGYRAIVIAAEPEAGASSGGRIGSCFSGGIDSYYSLLRHEPGFGPESAEPPADDLICIWGFGVRVHQRQEYESVLARLRPVAERFGKPLLTPATNLRTTRFNKLSWGYLGHGPALAAVALGLERRFGQVRIPASFRVDMKIKWGSNSDSVPLFSSAGLRFSNDGEDAIRTEKTALVAELPEALATLHVCWQDQSDRNCGACDKCLRTMLALEMLGKLQESPAFPAARLVPRDIARIFLPGYGANIIAAELIEFAEQLNRPEIAQAIARARTRSAWIRRVGNFGLSAPPKNRLGSALSRRWTSLLVRCTGSLGRV